jgi:uncharacterized surface protein with fasciclin (FAS1) repeats
MIKKIFNVGILLLLSVVIFTSCKKEDEVVVYPSLDSYSTTKGNLTIFKAALEKAQLQSFKDGPGPFTWIIPTDSAFTAASITLDSLNKMTPGQVNYLLMYHLINAFVTTPDMVGQNSFPRTTQLGANAYVGQFNNAFFINGSKLTSTDNLVSNGVVHLTSRVNIPPNLKGNIQAMLTSSNQHSLFIAALTRAGRWTVVGSTSVFTIFAPTDAAMIAAGYPTTTYINTLPVASVDSLVRYHMFSGPRLFSNDIGNKTTPGTFVGTSFTLVGSNDGGKIKGRANATAFDITKPDILGTNGVVHFINGVLKY